MIPVDEFYAFRDEEQERLVSKGHVVVDGAIATSVPDTERNVHIFERPVEDEIVETLQRGHYRIENLASEFPLEKRHVDSVVSELRYRPQRILEKYKSTVRVTDIDGTAYLYTVEPLPFEVRVWDPALGVYLIQENDSIPVPDWDSQRVSWDSGRTEYVDRMEGYWDLPESDAPEDAFYDLSFASSTLGPLPKSAPEDAPEVRERIRDVDGAYRRRQYDENKIERAITYHKSECRRNPSLASFQAFALYLYDLAEYVETQDHPEYRPLLQGGVKLYFACLFGPYRPRSEAEWQRFEVERGGDLDRLDERVVDIVELQPTSNGQLADRWGLSDGTAVHQELQGEFDRYAARNSDNYICATESARRYVQSLVNDGKVSLSKEPPEIPNRAKTVLNT